MHKFLCTDCTAKPVLVRLVLLPKFAAVLAGIDASLHDQVLDIASSLALCTSSVELNVVLCSTPLLHMNPAYRHHAKVRTGCDRVLNVYTSVSYTHLTLPTIYSV